MKLSRTTLACVAGLAMLILVQQLPVWGGPQSGTNDPNVVHAFRPMKPSDRVVAIPLAGRSGDLANRPYMHAKLDHSQLIFQGLVMRDFAQIEAGADAMALSSLNMPGVEPGEYREHEVFDHMNLEFRRLAERLIQAARERNLEGAAYVNEKLNATCISCHEYLRDTPSHTGLY